jgi:hypothetical protein
MLPSSDGGNIIADGTADVSSFSEEDKGAEPS